MDGIRLKEGMRLIGLHDFHGSIDIADPVNHADPDCRIKGIRIADGTYACGYREKDEGRWGTSIRTLGIYRTGCAEPDISTRRSIGSFYADSGLAGFFDDADALVGSAADWKKRMQWRNHCLAEEGFFCGTGGGGTAFCAYSYADGAGETAAIEILFF